MGIKNWAQKIAEFFGETTNLDPLVSDKNFSSEFLDADFLADLLPYRLFDQERKIYENASSFGFLIEVIPFLGGSEEVQLEMGNLLKEIGEEGVSIQCLMFADHRTENFLSTWAKPRLEKGGIFEKIAEKKMDFFLNNLTQTNVPPRIFRFFFSFSISKNKEKNVSYLLERISEKKSKSLETLSRLSRKNAFEVSPIELMELISGMVTFNKNPSIQNRKNWNNETWLSAQALLPGHGLEVTKDSLIFHAKNSQTIFKSYECIDFPDFWGMAYSGEFIGDFFNASYRIPSPFYIHYSIDFPNQQKLETKFQAKSKLLDHQSKIPSIVRMVPDLMKELEENKYVLQQRLEGEKFVETRLTCGIWEEKSKFIKSESVLNALFQKFGFKLAENHFVHLPDFISSIPMTGGEDVKHISGLRRVRSKKTTITSELSSFIPMVGEWWGNSQYGMLLLGRKGQIATWDPFSTQGNLNAVVVGSSGSGKSVFMQEMMMNQLGQGGRVFVLDLGRSFEKLCYLLEGQYLAFSSDSRLNLNPFSLIKSEGDLDSLNVALDMVTSIISTMAMPSHKIDKERSDIIGSLVKKVWEKKGKDASVDDVIEMLNEISYRSELMMGASESLKEGLKKFGRKGTFSNYFYGDIPVDFSNDLVVIETEELKNMADLQAVILQIFTLTISNQIFMGDRSKRCLICIDEAWDLLKSPQMEGFIESLARRLRKYNGSLVIGTQGLKDFDRSHGARAAFQNSNWLLMLGNDRESINTIKKENLMPMNDFKEAVISSLRKEDGKYSEIFIHNKGDGFFTVAQLKLDPFTDILYSTKAENFKAIKELQNQGFSIKDAIEWLSLHTQALGKEILGGKKIEVAINDLLLSSKIGEF